MTENTNTGGDHTATESPGDELVRMDWRRYEQPALGVIEAIAGVKDERPTDLTPLGNDFDVDALNTLLSTETASSKITISFAYQGLLVTIDQSGSLVIESHSEPDV